jgi:hypothetical protein
MLATISHSDGATYQGWIPLIEYIVEYPPLIVLLAQTLWPTKVIWWLMATVCALFGALTLFVVARIAWIPGELYRLAVLVWVSFMLYYDRPTARRKRDPSQTISPAAN